MKGGGYDCRRIRKQIFQVGEQWTIAECEVSERIRFMKCVAKERSQVGGWKI